MSTPRRWPGSYWQRVGVAASLSLPLAFLAFIVVSVILRLAIVEAMIWFGLFGIPAAFASSLIAAGLNAPGVDRNGKTEIHR